MISNREIVRLFRIYAELLLLHQKNERLAALLSGASYRINKMSEEITAQSKPQLTKVFRPEIVSIIEQIKSRGTIEALDELIQLTPPGLFEMMRIRGLGGKKLATLWKVAKIDTLEALLEACKKNKLTRIPGYGAKTQSNIITAIESYSSNKDRFHYASVADAAEELLTIIKKHFKSQLVSLSGEVRRQCTTVAEIEILTTITSKSFATPALRKVLVINSSKKNLTLAHTLDEIPVRILHTSSTQFYSDLLKYTGNDDHVNQIMSKVKTTKSFKSENQIYQEAGLQFIQPEMRENNAEWDFVKKSKARLVELEDIKGVVHNHTTWSDGVDSLPNFVKACQKRKYEYAVISDHSKNAFYANGLKEERVLQQMKEIDTLNKQLKSFRVFKSIECDILVSGDLDFDNSLLKKFDLVIVSIHQLLKMDEGKATRRLIKAIENPYTTILGHMTGRQLLIRAGYPVNFKKVIDACAANNVIIEINANPYRLDMDWSHIPYAMKKNVMISINPDAHSIAEIDNIRWGVSAARKGGLTRDMTWNAMSLDQILRWLKKK